MGNLCFVNYWHESLYIFIGDFFVYPLPFRIPEHWSLFQTRLAFLTTIINVSGGATDFIEVKARTNPSCVIYVRGNLLHIVCHASTKLWCCLRWRWLKPPTLFFSFASWFYHEYPFETHSFLTAVMTAELSWYLQISQWYSASISMVFWRYLS